MKIIAFLLLMFMATSGVYAENLAIETIAREASGEPFAAQVLVGRVIRQRMKERRLTSDEVVLQPYQFSCWNKGVRQKARTQREIETARRAWEESERINISINLYHDTSVMPRWANSERVTFVQQVGRLKFYNERR